jgi:hypothetical protein
VTAIVKYPRTQHLEGSRLQPGDHDLEAVPFRALRGRPLVVEEKLDGANCGVSFDEDGGLVLQSRGHALRGGAVERQFDLFKAWARCHEPALREVLGRRYVLYGEWLFAKHTVFYDALPHLLHEFDVLDREAGPASAPVFLSTERRRALLAPLPIVAVPVLHAGPLDRLADLWALVRPSLHKSPRWREALEEVARSSGQDVERVRQETDPEETSEGLYVKWEEDGVVRGRYKLIRASFLQRVLDSGSHWADRPILENRLRPGVDLFDPRPAGRAS